MSSLRIRTVVTIAALLILGGRSCADAAVLDFGILGGVTASRLHISGWGASDWHTGAAYGGFLHLELSAAFALQPSILYAGRGGRYTDRSSYPDGPLAEVHDARYSVDYLEVPVVLRYRTLPQARHHPVLIAGLFWRTPLSSELSWDGQVVEDWADVSDFGVVLGAGVESALGQHRVGVDVVYSRSFGGAGDDEYLTFHSGIEGLRGDLHITF